MLSGLGSGVGWVEACFFLRRTKKSLSSPDMKATDSLYFLHLSQMHIFMQYLRFLWFCLYMGSWHDIYIYAFMQILYIYILSTIFPRLYHCIISEWREMSSCLDIDSFLFTALHWSPLSYLITNIESLSLSERDGSKRWLSIRNAAPPRPQGQTVANQFQTNGSFIYITKANYCSLINQHILISSGLELGLAERERERDGERERFLPCCTETFSDMLLLHIQTSLRWATLLNLQRPNESSCQKKKRCMDECSLVLITFPKSLKFFHPSGLRSWRGCVEVWLKTSLILVCVCVYLENWKNPERYSSWDFCICYSSNNWGQCIFYYYWNKLIILFSSDALNWSKVSVKLYYKY